MSFTRPKNPVRVVIVVVLVLIAVNVALWGGLEQVNGPANVQRPQAIAELSPAENQNIPPQDAISVFLREEWIGSLAVDGKPIPDDQLSGGFEERRQLVFDPGPGKDIVEWQEGTHRAEVQFWPVEFATFEEALAQGRSGSYSWTFDVG